MQTKFTEEQLRDPDNFANEKVLKNVCIVECVMPHALLINFWVMS